MTKKRIKPIDMPVAERVKATRLMHGISVTGFAKKIGLSVQQLSNIEHGYPLSRDVALAIVRVTPGLTLDWLYLGRRDTLPLHLAERFDDSAAA